MTTENQDKEEQLLKYVLKTATKNNPKSVIDTIDKFCREKSWMMNVGDEKGVICDSIITKHSPRIMVELGGYCGYSAVRFGNLLALKNDGSKYISFEVNPKFADIMKQIIDFAGLSDTITIFVGAFKDRLDELLKLNDKVDLFFIDHWKDEYLPDAKLILDNGLLKSGSVLLADNVIYPGCPDYVEFVKNDSRFSYNETIMSKLEYSNCEEDALQYSIFKL